MRIARILGLVLIIVAISIAGAQAKNRADLAPVQISRGLLDCSQAIPIACGDEVAGSNVGAPSNVEYYSCSGWSEPHGEVVYELVLPGPGSSSVLVALTSMVCDLDVFMLADCDEGDCIAYGDEAAYVGNLAPGSYIIVVDGYSGECGYTLSVDCLPVSPACCPLTTYDVEFDFSSSDNGYWTIGCGGESTWGWGENGWTGSQGCEGAEISNLLCTSPNDAYPNNAGEAAVIGPVTVTDLTACLELCHAYYIEEGYDGGVVKISDDQGQNWETVTPARGYEAPTYSYTRCIPLEAAFADDFGSPWRQDCFDLSGYVDREILIGFFFGSDESVTYPGWYIHWARLGRAETSVAPSNWGAIKAIYR